ncbi:MAG: hemerythrin domain-containing protein [Actinobacteria bacterium]|nr:MAG: hemerythrin domain-containing protein [Actinomycetota bacterium]
MTQDQAIDVVDQLLQDHVEVRSLFTAFETARTAEERSDVFRHIVHDLSVHETAEEEVVWPVVRTDLAEGAALADVRIGEEEAANRLMAKLEALDFDGREFSSVFEDCRRAVLSHAEREENDVFPLLRQLDPGKLAPMATLVDAAKKAAPTHPHPHVPGTATANLLAGPAAAIVDRTRDSLRKARERLSR